MPMPQTDDCMRPVAVQLLFQTGVESRLGETMHAKDALGEWQSTVFCVDKTSPLSRSDGCVRFPWPFDGLPLDT